MVNQNEKSVEEVLTLDVIWYEKSLLLIDNVNNVVQSICIWTGFVVSIDDTMKTFKGVLKQNIFMNNKTVNKGQIFWKFVVKQQVFAKITFCYKSCKSK